MQIHRQRWPCVIAPCMVLPPASAVAGRTEAPLLHGAYLHAPELALVAQAVLAHKLQLSIQALLLEGTPGLLVGLAICRCAWGAWGKMLAPNSQCPVVYPCLPVRNLYLFRAKRLADLGWLPWTAAMCHEATMLHASKLPALLQCLLLHRRLLQAVGS